MSAGGFESVWQLTLNGWFFSTVSGPDIVGREGESVMDSSPAVNHDNL